MLSRRNRRRLGWAGFAFFAVKGVAWLVVAAIGARAVAGA
jgi:hypothetical protein